MIPIILLFACALVGFAEETLRDTLQAANIPAEQFSPSELPEHITSYAISKGDPFLLAYYVDKGRERLSQPLQVIRYNRTTNRLQRARLHNIKAIFAQGIEMDCLGSAMEIREHHGVIYIDTHYNPSAGCVIVLSSELVFQTALSGWLIGLVGSDYAIVQRSEVHFLSVHPLHIGVFDGKRNRVEEVYPVKNEPYRRQFSQLLHKHVSEKWCAENDAPCDRENFDTELRGKVVVDEAARSFALDVRFTAAGFGPAALKQVPPRTVSYTFHQRNGKWEHHAFSR
ncbi:MAG: hypothetical protein ABJF23_02670 [Bryobacteraceae bacterium]